MSAIAAKKVVSIHYTLQNGEGDTLDSSDGSEPLAYLHGAGNIVEGLEKALEGKTVGDKLKAVVPPAQGYGERQGPGPQPVPKAAFEGANVQPGMAIMAEDPEGNHMPLWVVAVEDDKVMVDGNHPLAGVTLHFDVEVVEVRDATEEEVENGHVNFGGDS